MRLAGTARVLDHVPAKVDEFSGKRASFGFARAVLLAGSWRGRARTVHRRGMSDTLLPPPKVHRRRDRTLRRIRRQMQTLAPLGDDDLRDAHRELVFRAKSGPRGGGLTIEAFALIGETIRRTLGMTLYDVQLLGGLGLCQRAVVEMATGEGKTLTAIAPLYVRALDGRGALLATSNSYLAGRDAEFARPVFEFLGMSVGSVGDDDEDEPRRAAYRCDVTYGTAVQFGFDFLRDRAKRRFNALPGNASERETPVQRDRLYSILVDEADSLLIDEAATPMLIAGTPPPMSDQRKRAFYWAADLVSRLEEGRDYGWIEAEKRWTLTAAGRTVVHRSLPAVRGPELSLVDYFEFVERAIGVAKDLLRDRNYILEGEEVGLVDEGTGRLGRGRQWSGGLQQAVQAKEGLPITLPTGHLAKVTAQSFFLAFEHLSGMTGTAAAARRELRRTYRLKIRSIPTRLATGRVEWPDLAAAGRDEWLALIDADCRRMVGRRRSGLVGTRNVADSEAVADYLSRNGVACELINARRDDLEAEIVGRAGQPGRVTVATNMAGRGTDIKLDPAVKRAGGLHVILAGIHSPSRVDRQLIGRSGRQGDPGSYRRIFCLEDDLLDKALTPDRAATVRRRLAGRFSVTACVKWFEAAQRVLSRREEASRRSMFVRDRTHLKTLRRAGLDPLLEVP